MIIVTGGAGFIGSAFVWKLNQVGRTDILIVDNVGESEKWKNLVGLKYHAYMHRDAFIDSIQNKTFKEKCDAIIHMGACSATTEKDYDFLVRNNVNYTRTLCDWARDHGAYFQYASSAATYGDGALGFSDEHEGIENLKPINRYGYSKHVFDLMALREGFIDEVVGLKFFNVFGPNEYHKGSMKSVACQAQKQILETGKLKLFKSYHPDYKDGGQQRDFVYVKDCVEVMYWLMTHPEQSGLFNIGTGNAQSWNDLAHSLFKALKKDVKIEYIDMPENIKNHYQYYTQADLTKLTATKCPIQFRSLDNSIDDYVNGYLESQSYLGI